MLMLKCHCGWSGSNEFVEHVKSGNKNIAFCPMCKSIDLEEKECNAVEALCYKFIGSRDLYNEGDIDDQDFVDVLDECYKMCKEILPQSSAYEVKKPTFDHPEQANVGLLTGVSFKQFKTTQDMLKNACKIAFNYGITGCCNSEVFADARELSERVVVSHKGFAQDNLPSLFDLRGPIEINFGDK